MTGLAEGQILFLLLLAAFLFISAAWWWSQSEWLRGSVFLLVSLILMSLWWFFVPSGFLILAFGIAAALRRYRWENIALLFWSIAGAGIGDAIFNNAILYRAVLMTDWAYSLIYLFAFHFAADWCSKRVLGAIDRSILPGQVSTQHRMVPEFSPGFEGRLALAGTMVAIVFGLFALTSSVRLAVRNLSGQHNVPPRLSRANQQQVVKQLRRRFPLMREVLADPTKMPVEFISPELSQLTRESATKAPQSRFSKVESPVDFARRRQLVVRYEELEPIVFFFPAGVNFAERDRLFRERPYAVSILPTSPCKTIFPGQIPPKIKGNPAVLVGWIEPPSHPSKSKLAPVIQCVAIIPVNRKGLLDYERAVIAPPQAKYIL